ncbi:MAG: response regulator [Anaerolineae bacterium]|nr:response regulator [Anaerolineae bacterium]
MSDTSNDTSALILVVDDDWMNREMMQAYLDRAGFRVLLGYDAASALAMAREHQPQLIMLDVRMGEIDGYDVCRDLKADDVTSHIPVVMLSALSTDEAHANALEAGAVAFITKTVNLSHIVASIRELLDLST